MEVDIQQQQQQPPSSSQPSVASSSMPTTLPSSQPPPPPSQSTNNNYYPQQHYDESLSQQQYQKPNKNINIRPLIDTNDSMSNESPESPPTVGFSSNTRADEYSVYPEDSNSSLSTTTRRINLKYQLFLDKISPHWKARWAFSMLALMVFMARVIISQGWYVICYALAIYYLNLLIGFISPKVDPGMGLNDDDELAGPMLPTHASDEFKPFIRRLPEFKFWISGTKATLISLFLSLFDIFDVPVFWPILLIYFIILFACTMRQQIKHMIRYSYVPWDSGKKKYASGGSDSSTNLYPETV